MSVLASDQALAAVERFAARVRSISWFAAVGEPLLDSERAESLRYLKALGLDSVEVAPAKNWADAERVARHPRRDRRWWDAEEAAGRALFAEAEVGRGRDLLLGALSLVLSEATNIVLGMASTSALRAGVVEHAIAAVAAGAATHACFQTGLALGAQAGETHPFAIKRRLFEGGRWPLGVVEGVFYIF